MGLTELEARAHRAVMRWASRPAEAPQLSPLAPLDAGLALLLPIVILALLAPLAV